MEEKFEGVGMGVGESERMKDWVGGWEELGKGGDRVVVRGWWGSLDVLKKMEDRGEEFKRVGRGMGE